MKKPKFEIGDNLAITLMVFMLLIFLFLLFGCHTPSITIYQQGESVGNGTIVVRETLNLNVVEKVYEGKAKVGTKVLTKRILP